MKECFNVSCFGCGFRFWPETVIKKSLKTIDYPIQMVCSAGRARGFRVIRYVPWSELSTFRDNLQVWRAINCEYMRLAYAYDNFHHYLHFVSPRMQSIIDDLNQEIFRLRTLCRELQDKLDRSLLAYPRRDDEVGDFRRILEEASNRDQQDRRAVLTLAKRHSLSNADRLPQSSPRRERIDQSLHAAELRKGGCRSSAKTANT
jgi:hypothetical protein